MIELTLSHSQVQTYDTCKFKWNLQYIEGWKTPSTSASNRGTIIHDLLNYWYQCQSEELWQRYAKDVISKAGSENFAEVARFVRITERYIKDFIPVSDTGQETLALEQHFETEFESLAGNKFKIQGYIDRIYRKGRNIFIEDFKTIGQAQGFWSQAMVLLDSQLTLYAALAPTVEGLNIEQVNGVSVTALNCYPYKRDFEQKAVNDLFRRETAYRSANEQSNVLVEFANKADEMLEHMERNKPFTKSLTKNCAKCDFSEICQYALRGVDVVPFLNTKFERKKDKLIDQLKRDDE